MRLSLKDKDDPSKARLVNNSKVTLDGVEQKLCVMADEDAGEILRYKTDANGKLVIAANNLDEAETETVKGVVKIIIPWELFK